VQLDIADEESDPRAWSDLRDVVFEDEDFLWLYSPELETGSTSPTGAASTPSSTSGSR
jgi:hypothetical protein